MWRCAWLLPLGLFGAACSGRTETIVVAGGAGGAPDGGAAGASGGQGGVGGSGGLAVFCPDGPGPELVAVESPAGWFCVGSTEVTEHDYADFLDENPSIAGQPAGCDWNTDYEIPWASKTPRSLRPRVNVDWCDARAYCQWAGQRLCGRPGGGTAKFSKFAAPGESEWYFACSRGGERTYPYGNTFESMRCFTAEHPTAKKANYVGWNSACEGGFTGLLDLSGNVAEWEDSCNTAVPGSGTCRLRGGSVVSPLEDARCQSDATISGGARDDHVGIRCCADPVPAD